MDFMQQLEWIINFDIKLMSNKVFFDFCVYFLWKWILSSGKKNWGNNVEYKPLNHKYKMIFKSKRNWEKLIDGRDVKIEENWRIFFWEDPFSFFIVWIRYSSCEIVKNNFSNFMRFKWMIKSS
jgi:hypothetical protein